MTISGKVIIINMTSIKICCSVFCIREQFQEIMSYLSFYIKWYSSPKGSEEIASEIKISAISFFSCDLLLGPQKNTRSRISIHARIQSFCGLWMSDGLLTCRRQPKPMGEPHLLMASLADHHLNWAGNKCNDEKAALLTHYHILISSKKVSQREAIIHWFSQ